MTKKKIKFKHFQRYLLNPGKYGYDYTKKDSYTTDTIQIYAGSILPEWLEDVELELKIVDGDIKITHLDKQNYEDYENKQIEKYLKKTDFSDGFEFVEFFDLRDQSVKCPDLNGQYGGFRNPYQYKLISDETSNFFDVMTSKENIKNLKKVEKTLKNSI